jgi:arginyl-tRNA synthetase
MADPELMIRTAFRGALAAAFGDEFAAVDPAIRPSQHADYQANAAMGLKTRLGRAPREIATALVERLAAEALIEKAEVAGPGFINITLRREALSLALRAVAHDQRLGLALRVAPETVVLDYSSPNVAKEMHVGHLRSTIIGDAIGRVLEAQGDRVIRQNHLGDWGTPFGMLIEQLLDEGDVASGAERSLHAFLALYQAARTKFDADPSFADRARRRVVLLQSGDIETLRLWKTLVSITLRECALLYAKLGVKLKESDVAGESFYNPLLQDVVNTLQQSGVITESQGALCAFPPGFAGREGTPQPLIVQKKDGGFGYAATDLAAVRYRIGTLGATRVLVVVGAPQAQHFAMLFETARQAGWLPENVRATHVAFGSVLGSDGKMFKTRAGTSVSLVTLLDEGIDRARAVIAEKNPELDGETRERVAGMVGIGAIKYADLSSDRTKDYVFDFDRMLAFEGNTAPYLQYAHARIRSILRKADQGTFEPDAIAIVQPQEKTLALCLLRFPTVVGRVAEALEPHQLCTYLFELATAFSGFYEGCSVLKAGTDAERRSRLALCELTGRVLARGLDLLGIEAPEQM